MSDNPDRIAALEAAIAALATRVAALEQVPPLPAAASALVPDPQLLRQLDHRRGAPYEQGDIRGAVTYAGAVHVGARDYVWQVERPLPGLLALEPAPLARVLAALSSPPRILLVRELLAGACTSQQLQAALGGVSPGQLYHHLKELLAAGIIEQHGRSDYRFAPTKIVPFLAVLAGALDLLGEPHEPPNSVESGM